MYEFCNNKKRNNFHMTDWRIVPHSMDSISHSSVPEPPSHPTRWKCRSPWQTKINNLKNAEKSKGKHDIKLQRRRRWRRLKMKIGSRDEYEDEIFIGNWDEAEELVLEMNIEMFDLRSMAMPMLLFVGNWFIWRRSNCRIEIKLRPLLDMFVKVFFPQMDLKHKEEDDDWKAEVVSHHETIVGPRPKLHPALLFIQ